MKNLSFILSENKGRFLSCSHATKKDSKVICEQKITGEIDHHWGLRIATGSSPEARKIMTDVAINTSTMQVSRLL